MVLGCKQKLQGICKRPHPVVCGRKSTPEGKDMPPDRANLQDWTLSETLCLDGWVSGKAAPESLRGGTRCPGSQSGQCRQGREGQLTT